MKYNYNGYYMQISRKLCHDPYTQLSDRAFRVYITLKELEQRYTAPPTDYFYCSNQDLAEHCGMSIATLNRAKKELLDFKPALLESWQIHFRYKDTGQISEQHVSAYRLFD